MAAVGFASRGHKVICIDADETEMINAGFGEDVSMKESALLAKQGIGFKGDMVLDKSRPDGMPGKLLDSSRMRKMAWTPNISLERGIKRADRCIWSMW